MSTYSTQEASNALLGQAGWDYLADTSTHSISNDMRELVEATTINEGAEFSATDLTLTVASGAVFPAGLSATRFRYIKIDNEILKVTAVAGNDLTVVRGQLGTVAVVHDDAASVKFYTPFSRWIKIYFITDTVFAAETEVYEGDPPETTETYAAGTTLFASFKKIDLASGKIYAYRG